MPNCRTDSQIEAAPTTPGSRQPAVICLSNVYDEGYLAVRAEPVPATLSSPKRRDLFHCLEMATGRKVIVLSAPPGALRRRQGKWLRPVETTFSTHRQFFCGNWDAPKVRVPLAWSFYAAHVLRHTQSGDVVMIDNYELLYILAACCTRLFRRVTFVLEYEDGKHLIDRSWSRVLSGCAEWLGRRLLSGAILVNPGMKKRLLPGLPTILIPGFVAGSGTPADCATPIEVHFLYSGTLDKPRGVDLLLQSLEHLPDTGWHLDITGSGPLSDEVDRVVSAPRYARTVSFHKVLSGENYQQLVNSAHVGLNCQRSSDPISSVTFPSKVFTYLSAGLVVLSSTASEMEQICGQACVYFSAESVESLSAAMNELIRNFSAVKQRLDIKEVRQHYSLNGTAARLREFLARIIVLR